MRPRGVLGLVLAGALLLAGFGLYELQQADEPTVAEAVAASCRAPELRAALAEEGYEEIDHLEHVRCSGRYAYALAVPKDPGVDPADSLFRYGEHGWRFLSLGTAIGTAAENHIPFEDFDRIMPDDRPR